MTQEAPSEKILDRIRRLLALSTSSNPYESSLAASKAQDLLLKYNLEMSQIQDKQHGDEVERQNFRTGIKEYWLDALMNAVARANLCRCVRGNAYVPGTRNGNSFSKGKEVREFYLFGKRPNLEVVEYMYCYLADEIDRITPKGQKATWVRNFRMGAVAILRDRLQADLQQFQSTKETTALVVTNEAAVEKAKNDAFPLLVKGRKASIGDYGAYMDGQAAGKSIQFRQGVAARSNGAGQALIGG